MRSTSGRLALGSPSASARRSGVAGRAGADADDPLGSGAAGPALASLPKTRTCRSASGTPDSSRVAASATSRGMGPPRDWITTATPVAGAARASGESVFGLVPFCANRTTPVCSRTVQPRYTSYPSVADGVRPSGPGCRGGAGRNGTRQACAAAGKVSCPRASTGISSSAPAGCRPTTETGSTSSSRPPNRSRNRSATRAASTAPDGVPGVPVAGGATNTWSGPAPGGSPRWTASTTATGSSTDSSTTSRGRSGLVRSDQFRVVAPAGGRGPAWASTPPGTWLNWTPAGRPDTSDGTRVRRSSPIPEVIRFVSAAAGMPPKIRPTR
ncbi:hypothetical protein B0E53_04783 [Micromonospora sp. MH33]|nr:hypothetical protein B0E53_04783 [Micromonospora sp. MH33]